MSWFLRLQLRLLQLRLRLAVDSPNYYIFVLTSDASQALLSIFRIVYTCGFIKITQYEEMQRYIVSGNVAIFQRVAYQLHVKSIVRIMCATRGIYWHKLVGTQSLSHVLRQLIQLWNDNVLTNSRDIYVFTKINLFRICPFSCNHMKLSQCGTNWNPSLKARSRQPVSRHLMSRQATGLDAWASRVKCPAQFLSHLHEICIYIYELFIAFVCFVVCSLF